MNRIVIDRCLDGLFLTCFAVLALALAGCKAKPPPPPPPPPSAAATKHFEDPYDLNRPDCRIGVWSESDSEEISRRIFNRAQIVPFDQMRSAAWQLMAEKIDGFVFDEHVLRLLQWKYPDRFRILDNPIDTDPSVIAVSKRRPALRDELNRFIADIRASGLYDRMFLRWCHDPERRPEDAPDFSKLIYSGSDARPLRVGVDPVQEPNAYFDKNGRLVGYDIEFIYRFGRAAKYRISFVEDDEKKLFGRLAAGEIDVIVANLARDPKRKNVLWTNGYLDSDIMMLVKEKPE